MSGIRVDRASEPANPRLSLPPRLYEWRGKPEQSLAAEAQRRGDRSERERGAPTTQQEASRRKRARFAEFRAEGLPILAAGKAVGVSNKTAYRYEEQRLLTMRGAGS